MKNFILILLSVPIIVSGLTTRLSREEIELKEQNTLQGDGKLSKLQLPQDLQGDANLDDIPKAESIDLQKKGEPNQDGPQSRSALDFGVMISKTTGRNPLDFNSYGNWCGIGGSGTPVDSIDQCCQDHDVCWDNRPANCKNGAFQPYFYYIFGKNENAQIFCLSLLACENHICECDKVAAECLRTNKDDYDPQNLNNSG